MSCYHPLKGFVVGETSSGKRELKIVSYSVDHLELDRSGSYYLAISPFTEFANRSVFRDYVTIPCGQCIGCRLDYSREWANRLMLEASTQQNKYFVTLTYDDDHIPAPCYEASDGFVLHPLCKRDVQLFMKRLRKAYPASRIRFYCAGEYGDTTHRPHYHMCLYGLELTDLELYKNSKLGFPYFLSSELTKIWGNGHVVVGELDWKCCAYVGRYVTKKAKGYYKDFYKQYNLVPEFALMSRKPGIARDYYDSNLEYIYQFDEIVLCTDREGLKFKPPKYFDHLFDIDDPETMEEVRGTRQRFAEERKKLKLSQTHLSYLELLSVEERIKEKQANVLVRSDF